MSASVAPGNPEFQQSWLRDRLEVLRLRLRRKVLWLRATWAADPLEDYHGLVISDVQADRLLQAQDPGAEANFYFDDPVAATLTAQLVQAEEAASFLDTPLTRLARTFALSPFEQEALLLCAAPWLDPGFHRLYAYIQDDVTRRLATPALAISTLLEPGSEPGEAMASLGTGAPLLRHRLVVAVDGASGGLDRQLSVDQRIADFLCDVDHLDARLQSIAKPVARELELPRHAGMIPTLARALRPNPRRLVNLYGRPDSGQRQIALGTCDALKLGLIEVDLGRLAGLPEIDDVIAVIERDARLSGLALYVDAYDAVPVVVERLDVPVFVVTRERIAGGSQAVVVEVPHLEPADSADLWRQALGAKAPPDGAVAALAEQFLLGPQGVGATSVDAIAAATARGGAGGPDPGELWNACREHSRRDMGQLAQRIKPCHTWEDLVLPQRLAEQLRDIAKQVTHRATVYRDWNVGARLNRGRAISALFAGPSGTGKTLAAEVLAAELEIDLYRVDLSSVIDKYIGETEKRLRQLFDSAEESGAIVLIDEADALTGRRTEIRDSHDRYANINVSYLLQRMEDFTGLVILATNRRSDIDRAFLRRLRFLLEFPFPSIEDRQRIWSRAIPPDAPQTGIDLAALGRLELSGGSIHNIAINASFLAAAEQQPISMRHLMVAAARECTKLDKLITPTEFGLHYESVVA